MSFIPKQHKKVSLSIFFAYYANWSWLKVDKKLPYKLINKNPNWGTLSTIWIIKIQSGKTIISFCSFAYSSIDFPRNRSKNTKFYLSCQKSTCVGNFLKAKIMYFGNFEYHNKENISWECSQMFVLSFLHYLIIDFTWNYGQRKICCLVGSRSEPLIYSTEFLFYNNLDDVMLCHRGNITSSLLS